MKDRLAVMRWRLLGITVALAATIGVLSLPAPASAASAGLKPSEAPLVEVGQHYFGNTNSPGVESPGEYWRLPPLLTGDAITVAWHANINEGSGGPLGPFFCLTQNVDDYNWAESDSVCNASDRYGVTSSGSARSVVQVRAASSDAFLEFQGCGTSCLNGDFNGAYEFTIESIQHAIGVSLAPAGEIQPTSTLTGSANLSSGAPVPDGLAFTLTASWVTPSNKTAHQQAYVVTSSGGGLTFPLNLPQNTEGNKVSFTISRAADPGYLEAKSASLEILVASPPKGIAVANPQAPVKHGTALIGLSCQGGGPCKGNLRLIARFHQGHRTHKATIGRVGFSVGTGQAAVARVKLSRRGRSLLRKTPRHRLRVRLVGQGVKGRQVALSEADRRATHQQSNRHETQG